MIQRTLTEEKETTIQQITTYSYESRFETVDSCNTISLLSWNITHKEFIEEYDHGNSDDLDWKHRLPKINAKLAQSNADIICLQEVDKASFQQDHGDYFQHPQRGYTVKCNYHPKDKKQKHGVIFSQAIMYKSSKFECKYEDYRGRTMILLLTNKLEQSQCTKCKHAMNACLYHSFFVATVHLESPRKGKANELTRVNQLRSVLNKSIKKAVISILHIDQNDKELYNQQIPDLRVIIAGDFNDGRNRAPLQMLLNKDNPHFPHLYEFKDAYHENIAHRKQGHHGLPVTDCNLRMKYFPSYAAMNNIYCIDLVMYTSNHMKLKGVAETLPKKVKDKLDWEKTTGQRIDEWIASDRKTNKHGQMWIADFSDILLLPNQDIPSDHLPLAAVFELENLCNGKNEEYSQCRCCAEQVQKQPKQKKRNKKMRAMKKRNYIEVSDESNWNFHEINSF